MRVAVSRSRRIDQAAGGERNEQKKKKKRVGEVDAAARGAYARSMLRRRTIRACRDAS